MRVAVDGQIFAAQRRGGISRYVAELIVNLRQLPEVEVVLPWRWTANQHALHFGLGRPIRPAVLAQRRAVELANEVFARRARAVDVVHHTFYRATACLSAPGAASVVTVYDMIPELRPSEFQRGNPHFDKEQVVRSASLVLCISESTRSELLDVYPDISAATAVTPLGVDPSFRPGHRLPTGWPERYLLHVGHRGGYKDFATLAQAFRVIRDEDPGIVLMTVGGGALSTEETRFLDSLGVAGSVKQATLSDAALRGAYANAAAFVFPSRHEGFGLPTIEAMASGCPAVVSDIPVMREVGGDAAHYFRAGDAEHLSHVLHEVLRSTDSAVQREHGLSRARSFTWRRTAELTAAAYRSVV